MQLLAIAFMAVHSAADETTGTGQGVAVWLSGLDFPVELAFAPDGRAFVTERFTGNIRVIDALSSPPRLHLTPFANVGPLNTSGEQGLLGLALDPDFSNNPWVYVYHTFDNGTVHDNRVTRFWAQSNVSSRSEVIFSGITAGFFHNGGVLRFGSDGTLYITVGEANVPANAQNQTGLNGKILRINRDGSVPSDNPFPGSPVFTMGHRNVFGIDENPRDGVMFVSENGDHENDEVNRLTGGANYGWPIVNGTVGDARFVDPLWNITPPVAPTGLVFDRASFGGTGSVHMYVADWNTASIRRFRLDPPNYNALTDEQIVITRSTPSISSLSMGPGGLLYISTPTSIFTSDLHLVGNQPPVPAIYVNRPIQFVGQNISFGSDGSFDPEGGGIYLHHWDFGDGTSINSSWVVKAYAAAGNYTVTLTVSDEQNSTNSTSLVVHVKDLVDNLPPEAQLLQNRSIQFVGRNVSFSGSNSSDPEGGGIWSYIWELGDSTTTNGTYVSHAYNAAGSYQVNLTVTDEWGVRARATANVTVLEDWQNTAPTAIPALAARPVFAGFPARFTGTASSDAEGGIKGYQWDFGDGATANNGTPTHTYASTGNFTASLTVFDELGASGAAQLDVHVLDPASNKAPVAVITPPPGYILAGENAAFTANDSSDPEGGDIHFEWSFGNGGRSDGARVEYVYDTAGQFDVTLEATDLLGATGRTSVTINVYEGGPPPVVTIARSDWYIPLGGAVYLDGSGSRDPLTTGYITDAFWNFGDGTTAKGLQVWHTYSAPGTYTVTLTVINDRGSSSTNSSEVHVGPREQPTPAALAVALVAPLALFALVFRRRAPPAT